MTIDWDKPIEDDNGRRARVVGRLECGKVVVEVFHGVESAIFRVDPESGAASSYSYIRNVKPKRVTFWLNWYGFEDGLTTVGHKNKQEADLNSADNRKALLEVITENGVPTSVVIHKV